MIRKTALLYSMTGALMIAAPAFAQEQTQDLTSPPAAAQTAAEPQSLTLTPGSIVKSADGTELGKLVGARNGASGQELTVRGADGTVRPVALNGIRQDGSDIVVDATLSEYQSSQPIADEASALDAQTKPADADKTDANNTDEGEDGEPRT